MRKDINISDLIMRSVSQACDILEAWTAVLLQYAIYASCMHDDVSQATSAKPSFSLSRSLASHHLHTLNRTEIDRGHGIRVWACRR